MRIKIRNKKLFVLDCALTALSELNGDSSGSGSGDSQTSNKNTTNNSTVGGEGETTHETAQKNQTEGI